MGSDGVELILAVEDAFQINISDEEAANVSTVGDLHNLVVSKLQGQRFSRCLTIAAFYRTRRGIIEVLRVSRREIRPSTPLDTIFPRGTRREEWHRVQNTLSLKLPTLQHPGWIQFCLLSTGVMTTVGTGMYCGVGLGWLALLFLIGIVAGGFLIRLSPLLATSFPNGNVTVGDLARDVLAVNHARLIEMFGGWNTKDVWESLCRLIVIETRVAPEKITPDARIVDDLRID